MPKLTVKQLEALDPKDDGAKLREDGGLIGTVKSNAAKTAVYFDWRYRYEGKVRQVQVGTWPKRSLVEIRKERDRLAAMVQDGRDPALIRKAERLAKQAEEAESIAKQENRIADAEALQARLTVKQLFARWEELELSRRKDKGAEIKRCFEKDVFPAFGKVAVEDVKRPMIAACLDEIVRRGARIVARNTLGDLRQIFGFAIKRGYIENDPSSHLKRDDFGRKVARSRVLDEPEIRKLHTLLPEAGMKEASAAAVWIMLSTLCRIGELSRAEWKDVDLEGGTWRIPPENSKNAKEHKIYLSDFAKNHFADLQRLATDEDGKIAPWVMPATNREGPVCVRSLAKQIADRQRNSKPMKNRSNLTSALALPRGKWVPHDLRRSGATLMGELGVRSEVIEKCLNHTPANMLIRTYQRQSLATEQKNAWNLLGQRLEILTSDAGNIVTLSQKA